MVSPIERIERIGRIEHIGRIERIGPFEIPSIGPRYVRFFCPACARDASEPRPALFMFDGQNVFDDGPSFAGGWHLDRAVSALAKRHGRAPVIAAVEHGGHERIHELIPWATDRGGGRAPALVDWLADVLVPQLQDRLGLAREPRAIGVGGSSLGGLAALYAHFKRPDRFGLALAMSPSLFVANGRIFEMIAGTPRPWATRIYLDAGGLEAGGAMLKAAERLAGDLRARGWDDASLKFVAAKRAGHNERAWRRRAPGALAWLFVPGAVKKPRRKAP